MTAQRFSEIMEDKGLTISIKVNRDNQVDLTINPLFLDEIRSYVHNNDLDCMYDEEAIRNHTMELTIYS